MSVDYAWNSNGEAILLLAHGTPGVLGKMGEYPLWLGHDAKPYDE